MFTTELWKDEFEYRRTVLKVVIIPIIIAGCIFVVNNWIVGLKIFALIELALVIFSLLLLSILKKTPKLTLWTVAYLIALYCVVLVGLNSVYFNSALFVWLFMIPVLSYLLLGIRLGVLFSIIFVTLGVTLLVWRMLQNDNPILPIAIVNIVLCLAAIWALSHSYELKRAETVARLQHLASLDPLTGVNNRLHLESVYANFKLNHEGVPSIALLLVDLDYFKRINDLYGHDVGDEVLVIVANILKKIRRHEDWVFRIGGEEFCLLLPATTLKQAVQIAERLRKEIEEHQFKSANTHFNMSASIGVANSPIEEHSLSQLFKVADQRLYRAKKLGRNTVVGN